MKADRRRPKKTKKTFVLLSHGAMSANKVLPLVKQDFFLMRLSKSDSVCQPPHAVYWNLSLSDVPKCICISRFVHILKQPKICYAHSYVNLTKCTGLWARTKPTIWKLIIESNIDPPPGCRLPHPRPSDPALFAIFPSALLRSAGNALIRNAFRNRVRKTFATVGREFQHSQHAHTQPNKIDRRSPHRM